MDKRFNSEAAEPITRALHWTATGRFMEPLEHHDLRCECGKLLARWTAAGCEIKCARCKATWLLPWGTQSLIRQKPNQEIP